MKTLNRLLVLSALPLLFAGCGTVTVNNLTPRAMTRNPSGLYPIAIEVIRNDNTVVDGTVQPIIVTPDQSAPMVMNPAFTNRWEYTIAIPATETQRPYHFKINYMLEKNFVKREPGSTVDPKPPLVYMMRITDQTAVGLDARRGRVGSTIKVLGRGFSPKDQILLGGKSVTTKFENENTLSFQVPPVDANRTYIVEVKSGNSQLKFGELLVDDSNLLTTPSELNIPFESTADFSVIIPQPAPAGGLAVKFQVTDATIIEMPGAANIPAGQTRATVRVKGKHIGQGVITARAEGFGSSMIPYRVALVKSVR